MLTIQYNKFTRNRVMTAHTMLRQDTTNTQTHLRQLKVVATLRLRKCLHPRVIAWMRKLKEYRQFQII